MYNGIGLTTPRGSGTNGYVVRNLSVLRRVESHQDRQSAWDAGPPKHREPDQAILEHESKRKVEVKCLELQLTLEEDGVDEDEIETQVAALREKLLANLSAFAPVAKSLKASDTHALAAVKKTEIDKMARAFGTRSDYREGDAFDREKQEEMKMRRFAEREEREQKRQERERQKEEERVRMAQQKARWEAEKRERDKLRAEDRSLPTGPRAGRRDEDRFADRRGPYRANNERRSRSPRRRDMPPPPPPRDRERERERERGRERSPPRSQMPPPRVRSSERDRERERDRDREYRSLPPRSSRPVSSPRRYNSRSRSRSLPTSRSPSRSPPPQKRERSASVASTGSSMSVSSRSSAASRSRSRD